MEKRSVAITPAALDDASFIARVYRENLRILHGAPIPPEDWQALLADDDPDERHFILYEGGEPCGWLKLNGLEGDDTGWISMLVVLPERQRKGLGTAALAFAENFLRRMGKRRIGLHTSGDNLPALSLYRGSGFEIVAIEDCRWDDQTLLPDITLMKRL